MHRLRCWRKRAQVEPSATVVTADGGTNGTQTQPQKHRRGLVSADAVPFSWIQCVFSTCAYIWLLSSFVRTEFAILNLANYGALEPDVLVNLGPYAYSGNVYSKLASTGAGDFSNVTASKPVTVWSYKFDTTSLAMRAFRELTNASGFPGCILYRGECTNDTLAPATAMHMLDSLVDAVRHKASNLSTSQALTAATSSATERSHTRPLTLLLRMSYDYFDRIHHYLMPWIFQNRQWRTTQALYYSSELLEHAASTGTTSSTSSSTNNSRMMDLCSLAYGEARPLLCDESWTNFRRACKSSNHKCRIVERVSLHAMHRLTTLQATYANATVDLLVLYATRDISIYRGGLTHVAKRGADVVTLMRVRNCTPARHLGASGRTASAEAGCDTILLDDYRYEMETCTTDVLKWARIVYLLRVIAQTYYWLRLAMLFGGCYAAAAAAASATATASTASKFVAVCATARRALVTFFKVPSQVIVYGSPFPVACYLLAHIIDAPMVYDVIEQQFDSLEGLMHLRLVDIVAFSSIQMRNVWIIGAVAHVAVRLSTQHNWSPADGVWGLPQFSIAIVSSLTIVSQFRFLSLRQTPVTSTEHVAVLSRLHPKLESLFLGGGSSGKTMFGGVFLDAKAVASSAVVVSIVASALTLAMRIVFPSSRVRLVFWRSYSVTPLSASVLWSTNALAVSWSDDVFYIHRRVQTVLQTQGRLFHRRSKVDAAAADVIGAGDHRRHESTSSSSAHLLPTEPMPLESLDDRSEAVEATLFLMNITMLSDPLTLLVTRHWRADRKRVGYYRSAATQHVYVLPLVSVAQLSSQLDWSALTLERTVAIQQLAWSELITCG